MLVVFADKDLEKLVGDQRKLERKYGALQAEKIHRRYLQLLGLSDVIGLVCMPGRYHKLKGDREGQWACDLEHPFRLVFRIVKSAERKDIIDRAFHPGDTLDERLEELGMSYKEFAARTGKPEKTIIDIVEGRSSITPDMAVAFENVLGISVETWLNLQGYYDEYQARLKMKKRAKMFSRWIYGYPCIQMLSHTEEYENFWFTLFHEIGHILLHGKKDIFLEEVDYEGRRPDKEAEADAFATRSMERILK